MTGSISALRAGLRDLGLGTTLLPADNALTPSEGSQEATRIGHALSL